MSDPIGTLIVDAEKRAKRKPNGHTSEAPCGCRVRLTYFTAASYALAPERCTEHPVRR